MGLFDGTNFGFNPNVINSTPINQRIFTAPSTITPVDRMPTDLIKVNGIESAKQYPMQPNSRVALFDANDDVMYIKQTDASNFPTITRFRFVLEEDPVVNKNQFVTVEEFNSLKEELNNVQQFIRESRAAAGQSTAKRSGQFKKHDADVQSIE